MCIRDRYIAVSTAAIKFSSALVTLFSVELSGVSSTTGVFGTLGVSSTVGVSGTLGVSSRCV